MKRHSGGPFRLLAATAVIIAALFLLHAPILNWLAQSLVRNDPIKPCDAIVVLAGDYKGERMVAAADLLKKGYGGKIVFWGGPIYWKITYAELYARLLKEQGVDIGQTLSSGEELKEVSTRGEAAINMKLLTGIRAKSFIIVTSDYHSARAGYVYAPLAAQNGMAMSVHPVADPNVHLVGWWKDRASAKMVRLELEKTLWYRIQNLL